MSVRVVGERRSSTGHFDGHEPESGEPVGTLLQVVGDVAAVAPAEIRCRWGRAVWLWRLPLTASPCR